MGRTLLPKRRLATFYHLMFVERPQLTAIDHEALVRTANQLPPLPQIVLRINDLLADPNFRIQDVAATVQVDSVLTGRLLRAANSPLYPGKKVSEVREAVIRIGAGTVRSIAIAGSARPSKTLDLSPFDLTPESYWHHSVAVLSFAEELMARKIADFGHDFSTAALLHDFGKLVLARHVTAVQDDRMRRMRPHLRSIDREQQVLTINHADVSAIVLRTWQLPDSLVKTVKYHHMPSKHNYAVTHGLNIANQLAWEFESRDLDLSLEKEAQRESMQFLKMTPEQLQGIVYSGEDRFRLTMEIFGEELAEY